MKKRTDLKLLSILCVVALLFMAMSTFAFSAKKEKAQEWIYADEDGEITLEGLTVTFDPGVLKKDTKIHIVYFGDGEYQLGPEIKVNKTFIMKFADAPEGESVVMTFKNGEWVEMECIDGIVVTNHFSRYRGAW